MALEEKKKILVVGSLNMDQTIGVVDIPRVGESVMGYGMTFSAGGKGANQAYSGGKLGGDVVMLGSVGDDDFGRQQRENLQSAGVDASKIRISPTEATGTAVIYVNKDGNNCIVIAAGANNECDIPYLSEHTSLIGDCEYVLMQMEIPHEAVYYMAETAAKLGKKVVLNPAPAPDSLPDEIYPMLEYITPNETELMKLTGMPGGTPEEIRAASLKLYEKGVKNVLVTVGEQGVILTNENGTVRYPTFPQKPVDTTAAGDTFNAAFLVGLSEGKSVEEAIRFGNMASSITVTRKGAQAAIPSREEVEEAMKDFRPVTVKL